MKWTHLLLVTSFAGAVLAAILVANAGSTPVSGDRYCRQASAVQDPSLPLNYPDRFAWELFVQVNRKASAQHIIERQDGREALTNSAIWETWPDDPWTFPQAPNPDNPPKWPDEIRKALNAPVKGSFHRKPVPESDEDFTLDIGREEVHRNRHSFDYIIENDLWYTQGIASYLQSGKRVDFPIDSIEVMAKWIPIEPADKSRYHWNYDKEGHLFGLVAMHISSKALPNRLWATFEWAGNKGRCDYIGCKDCFGFTPHIQPSHSGEVYRTYPSGSPTPALLDLFQRGGLVGEFGQEWLNYRLKGSQIDFTDSIGSNASLGNSVSESGFVQTASCMACHSRAAVNVKGENAFPIFGERHDRTQESKTPLRFQTQTTTHNRFSDPNWLFSQNGQSPPMIDLQVDFVWAIPIRAHPAEGGEPRRKKE